MPKDYSAIVIPFPDAAQAANFEALLNTEEAAQMLGDIHPKTLMRRAREGQIPGYQIGRFWYFRSSELNHWLLSSRQPIRPH